MYPPRIITYRSIHNLSKAALRGRGVGESSQERQATVICCWTSRKRSYTTTDGVNGYNAASVRPLSSISKKEKKTEMTRMKRTMMTSTTHDMTVPTDDDDDEWTKFSSQRSFIRGEILNLGIDMRTVRMGDKLEIPYELTISESMQDFWHSAFYAQDRIQTSQPFCRKIGLQDRVLPFSLALSLCSSMSHEDSGRIHVGFGPIRYIWPCFAGDTFTKTLTVNTIHPMSDGSNAMIEFQCDLINQRGRLCMRASQHLLVPWTASEPVSSSSSSPKSSSISSTATSSSQSPSTILTSRTSTASSGGVLNSFRDHLLSQCHVLKGLTSQSVADLRQGQLILHSMKRSLTLTQSQQLANLMKLTHETYFDTTRRRSRVTDRPSLSHHHRLHQSDNHRQHNHDQDRIRSPNIMNLNSTTHRPESNVVVPPGLVLGLTLSLSAQDFHEVLHEEILNVHYVKELHPSNMVNAISYIQKVEDIVGDLQLVTVRTYGIKHVNVLEALDKVDLPLEFFVDSASSPLPSPSFAEGRSGGDDTRQGAAAGDGTNTSGSRSGIDAKMIQRICKESCPQLYNQIVVQVDRRILRQVPPPPVFLL